MSCNNSPCLCKAIYEDCSAKFELAKEEFNQTNLSFEESCFFRNKLKLAEKEYNKVKNFELK